MHFENFVGLRYLMAKRDRNVLSVITLISIAGVAVGVMALIVVLSVMSGFEIDFREKIIGTKAHIVVSAQEGYLENYQEITEKIRTIPTVLGASPYVEAEVMISSTSNLQGIILRGIDTQAIREVSNVHNQIKDGSLEYIDHPDELPTFSFTPPVRKSGSMVIHRDPEDGELTPEDVQRLEAAGAKAAMAFAGGDHGNWIASLKQNSDIQLKKLQKNTEITHSKIVPNKNADGLNKWLGDEKDFVEVDEDRWIVEDIDAMDAKVLINEANHAFPNNNLDPDQDPERPLLAEFLPQQKARRTMKSLPGLGEDDIGVRQLGGIIPGTELKKSMNMFLGSEVNIMSPTGDIGPTGGLPKSRPFKTVGSFYSGMFEFDTKLAYISIKDAQKLLNIGDRVTGIDVKIENFEKSAQTLPYIQDALKAYPNIKVEDWRMLNGSLFGALMLEKKAMFLILTSIVLVASFNILCLLIMMVIEKGREIAIMKSMGANNKSIVQIFVVQGAAIGILGTCIGCLAGLALCWLIANLGINFPGQVYYLAQIPIAVSPLEVLLTCLAAIAVSLLATILPAYMALRLKPVDGLRFE